MDIRTQLTEIAAELKKPSKDVSKLTLSAKLLSAVASVQSTKEELPADLFAIFDNETRRLALTLLLSTSMHVILE